MCVMSDILREDEVREVVNKGQGGKKRAGKKLSIQTEV